VLHVINGQHYAGAERVQDHLAMELPRWGFEVGFACLKPDAFSAMRHARQAELYRLPMASRFDLRAVLRLARLIRRGGYALVHTHTPRAALVGGPAAALARVPLVHHVHGRTSDEMGRRWLSRTSAAVERISLWRAAGLIPVSPSLRRYLGDHGYARHRLWLVPNGVPCRGDLPPWSPREPWTLGLLAWFRPRKGVEVLLEAIARLKAAGLAVRLRAAGNFETPEYEGEIRAYAARLQIGEQIEWLGFRRDVQAELEHMDVLVLPSVLSEGMPMSVLEAMAAGTIVVATRVDGVTDVIRDGVDGLLAQPGDPGDLARVLALLLSGQVDARRLRANAHRRQAEQFSVQSMAAGVAQVYREVLGR
jgi:glycosyltransferase involved in cell wall biosynthesis